MALSLLLPPRSPALSRDDNWAVFESSLPTTSARPGFLISGVANDGNALEMRWANTFLALTFATAPDNSGTQLRAANGQAEADYLPQLLEALAAVPAIESDFTLELRADGIRLRLRDALNGDLAANASGITITIFTGGNTTQYPNLRAAVSVYRVGQPAPVLRARPAYDAAGRTEMLLENLLELQLGLPDAATLAAGASTATRVDGFAEYFLRYADAYGNPAQPETLTKSSTFAVVAGGGRGHAATSWGTAGSYQICHAYRDERGAFFPKPITWDQPDFVYVYADMSGTIRPRVTVYYTDGSTRIYNPAAAQSVTRGVYAFPSGPAQIGLADVAGAPFGETPVRYLFEVVGSGARVTYDLRAECLPWQRVLAFENGVGGIETVCMGGKTQRSENVSRSTFRRARTRVRGRDEGAVVDYNVEGAARYRLRSGYLPAAYVEHLRQLLYGRVWLCDLATNSFIAVRVTDSTISLTEDDDDLHFFELTIEEATPSAAAHNL